ncbi:nitroreductase family deazaflavin-dependent oxidoreductase [Nonomuraea sp. NN258]|uniref:nitroreductase/quinone reductase family protein n=1 Tax=Nonomuraea antri TaxID=2730852 RepID=UPI001569A060|nr:nitroreductase/quinone reductase family protein [Nonomuraea antri]NRQ38055.1 nitroreductase family deazaflavin-dependent oxidoreductase [Nonomuraea antri]
MSHDFNQQIIDEFRANQGRVGGPFEGARLLLLTTVGAKTGVRHTTPLGYLPDGGERIVVIASAGGSPRHPAWYHNLRANPEVTVEDGTFTYPAKAIVLEGEERDRLFARAVEQDPGWGEYEVRSGRTLPVVALVAVNHGPPAGRMGDVLRQIHDAFRRELALIRAEVAAAGPRLGAQLRINCLTMCQGLHIHHEREDAGMFPALADRHPELAPAIERLRAEHVVVQQIVARLQELLADDDVAPEELRREVDRLTGELEAHLDYEEEQLVPLLNG